MNFEGKKLNVVLETRIDYQYSYALQYVVKRYRPSLVKMYIYIYIFIERKLARI